MKFKKIASLPAFELGETELQHGDVVPTISGSQAPSPILLDDSTMRIYFSSRDTKTRSLPFFFDVNTNFDVVNKTDMPVVPLGNPGEADEAGVMPSHAIGNSLYYTGWNRVDNNTGVRYRTACMKVDLNPLGKKTLIFDRLDIAPCGTSMPFFEEIEADTYGVMKYRLHFMSYKYWKDNEPYYTASYKQASWSDSFFGDSVSHLPSSIARPVAYKDDIFYSERAGTDYRLNKDKSYRIFYTDSKEEPKQVEILGGEDDLMQAYGYPIDFAGKTILLYNNTFTGPIQVAELVNE
jgi:hypothetical protein